MMAKTMLEDDAILVERSKAGDRDAFGHLVERYQRLICSLAYSGLGSIPLSEDVAQETFLAAWKNLRNLREPQKVRSWLCGIARNLINNTVRRHGYQRRTDPIETLADSPSPEPAPAEQAVTREEAALLWRSLEKIPETYREPMILFYREQQSIERVARALELSEDAVKQRLSRGRKLLQEELAEFVEGALLRSAPTRAFTVGVIAALPAFALSASAATAGAAAAKGSSAAAGASAAAWSGALLGPIIGIGGAYIGAKASLDGTRTPRERAFVKSKLKSTLSAALLFNVAILAFVYFTNKFWRTYPAALATAGVLIPLAFTIYLVAASMRYTAQFTKIRDEERKSHPDAFSAEELAANCREYRTKASLLGLPLIHCLAGDPKRAAMGWIALGDRAYGILFAGGGFAVGGVAMGGIVIGGLGLGGASIGFLALGGLAVGYYAMGGAALGILAAGGVAAGLLGGYGGLAFAQEFAFGGLAVAKNANNDIARQFFANYAWMDVSKYSVRNPAVFLIWLPVIAFVAWQRSRQRKMPVTENAGECGRGG